MYLKAITLRGFKSFADKEILKFEPGISVIIGPNGSGKSNIVDALLWVLGEQSSRSLRGGSMEDVVFSGSSSRSQLGVAEGVVVLDNSDSYLPLDFSEVTIGRRIYRSGENEYFLNNMRCRLTDIQELISDAGIGLKKHTIIGQGQIESIVSSTPEDKRLLIEEVAGILKFKRRKDKAIKKLVNVEDKILRARDILTEVRRQLIPLRKQAEKTDKLNKLSDVLKEYQISLAVYNLKKDKTIWEKSEVEDSELEDDLSKKKDKILKNNNDVKRLENQLDEKGIVTGSLSEKKEKLHSIHERLNGGLLLLEEKGKNLIQRLSEIRQKSHQAKMIKIEKETRLNDYVNERNLIDASLVNIHLKLKDLRKEGERNKKEKIRLRFNL
ncbi:MAG: AAA family ATPase, partial [Actinomycetia bacterium]|nr:AAA family ATPase [Actinomycetes bacterium]